MSNLPPDSPEMQLARTLTTKEALAAREMVRILPPDALPEPIMRLAMQEAPERHAQLLAAEAAIAMKNIVRMFPLVGTPAGQSGVVEYLFKMAVEELATGDLLKQTAAEVIHE